MFQPFGFGTPQGSRLARAGVAAAALLIAAASVALGAQVVEKLTPLPASLLKCLESGTCRNTTQTRLNWFDQVGIPVTAFTEDAMTYSMLMSSRRPTLSVWGTPAGQARPAFLFGVWVDGDVVSGETSARKSTMRIDVPGFEVPDPKSFLSSRLTARGETIGAEYRVVWQDEYRKFLAAVKRRVLD